jgi:hypothetical protein
MLVEKEHIHSLVKFRKDALGLFFSTRRFELCALNSGTVSLDIF